MVQEDTENINLFGVKDCKKTADELKFKWNLRTKIKENHVEAYNWVVSICLKSTICLNWSEEDWKIEFNIFLMESMIENKSWSLVKTFRLLQ